MKLVISILHKTMVFITEMKKQDWFSLKEKNVSFGDDPCEPSSIQLDNIQHLDLFTL